MKTSDFVAASGVCKRLTAAIAANRVEPGEPRAAPKAVLLVGPPACGKTSLARAWLGERQTDVLDLSAAKPNEATSKAAANFLAFGSIEGLLGGARRPSALRVVFADDNLEVALLVTNTLKAKACRGAVGAPAVVLATATGRGAARSAAFRRRTVAVQMNHPRAEATARALAAEGFDHEEALRAARECGGAVTQARAALMHGSVANTATDMSIFDAAKRCVDVRRCAGATAAAAEAEPAMVLLILYRLAARSKYLSALRYAVETATTGDADLAGAAVWAAALACPARAPVRRTMPPCYTIASQTAAARKRLVGRMEEAGVPTSRDVVAQVTRRLAPARR